jgi:hypothetical protein
LTTSSGGLDGRAALRQRNGRRRATAILAEAGLYGHRHAIDAMLSATALAAPGPVTVLTSDPEDIATLCGRNVTVIKVLRDGLARSERDELARLQRGRLGCLSATMADIR